MTNFSKSQTNSNIPPWLVTLLQNYGGDEGIELLEYYLAQTETYQGQKDDSADISDVLEDIATSMPTIDQDDMPTSVDWGEPADEESSAPDLDMDDLLADFETSSPEPPAGPPLLEAPAEAPDWLDDIGDLTSTATTPEPETSVRASAPTEEDVPDWLDDFGID
jgi:hypothetical protein